MLSRLYLRWPSSTSIPSPCINQLLLFWRTRWAADFLFTTALCVLCFFFLEREIKITESFFSFFITFGFGKKSRNLISTFFFSFFGIKFPVFTVLHKSEKTRKENERKKINASEMIYWIMKKKKKSCAKLFHNIYVHKPGWYLSW